MSKPCFSCGRPCRGEVRSLRPVRFDWCGTEPCRDDIEHTVAVHGPETGAPPQSALSEQEHRAVRVAKRIVARASVGAKCEETVADCRLAGAVLDRILAQPAAPPLPEGERAPDADPSPGVVLTEEDIEAIDWARIAVLDDRDRPRDQYEESAVKIWRDEDRWNRSLAVLDRVMGSPDRTGEVNPYPAQPSPRPATRATLRRSPDHGGHYPDCIPGVLCHCPIEPPPRPATLTVGERERDEAVARAERAEAVAEAAERWADEHGDADWHCCHPLVAAVDAWRRTRQSKEGT